LIDRSVGEGIKTLRNLRIDRSMLVIFIFENDPWINYGNHAGSTTGLRKNKRTTFESEQ
jgi:hypothetical protein